MPSCEYHCLEATKVFGARWEHVHKWLDGLAVKEDKFDMNHRRHRHHLGGVQEVERMWGETAAAVARQHIIADEGRVYTEAEGRKLYPDAPDWVSLEVVFGKREHKKKEWTYGSSRKGHTGASVAADEQHKA